MKILILVCGVFFSGSVFAQTKIFLDPGSTIVVEAGDEVTVSCSGSSTSTLRADCTVTPAGQRDKYGTKCDRFTSGTRCAVLYEFGLVSEKVDFTSVTAAASWCDSKLAQF